MFYSFTVSDCAMLKAFYISIFLMEIQSEFHSNTRHLRIKPNSGCSVINAQTRI